MRIKTVTKKSRDGVIFKDKTLYRAKGKKKPRSKRMYKTSEKQRQINARRAERKILELIHNNFEGGIFLTLTFAGVIPEDLKKTINNFLRRLRYSYNSHGGKLKYIAAVEFKDCRPHLHMIINKHEAMEAMNRNELEEYILRIWKHGDILRIQPLIRHGYYKNLVEYMVKDITEPLQDNNAALFGCRCIHSKGLDVPEPETEITDGDFNDICNIPDTEIIDGEEYELIWESQYTGRNELNGAYYVTYALKPTARTLQARRKRIKDKPPLKYLPSASE